MGGDRVAWREHRVSRACPCPVCGKEKPCLAFPSPLQPAEVVCTRVASEEWVEGLQGWRHKLEPSTGGVQSSVTFFPQNKKEIPKAEPQLLDDVWKRVQELSEPLDGRRHLPLFMSASRGMTAAQVKARGYFPWLALADRYTEGYRRDGDSRWLLPAKLVTEFGEKVYQVPGFGKRVQDGRPWAAGWSGIFLPCRDAQGRIVGGQVMPFEAIRRKHGAPKYATLSAGRLIGAEAGHLLHCARPTGLGVVSRVSRVWLTEGLLKADIASDLLGEVVLGAAGQKFEEEALANFLETLAPSEVIIALDYDTPGSNAAAKTDKARKTLADQLVELGYQVSIARWESEKGKGLDDLLLAGEGPVLREYLGRRRRPRLAGPVFPEVGETPLARPMVSVDEQRAQYADTLRDYLANRNGTSAQEVLLVRLAPGIGKTTTFETVAREYTAKDRTRSLIHFVPTHQVGQQEGADQSWHQVYGRTSDKAPHGRPCHEPDKARALGERGDTNGGICRLCTKKSACEGTSRSPEAPYYLGQFHRRQMTRLPAAHLLSSDLVARCGGGPLVIDDIDLDQLQLSATWVTERDLTENLSRAKGEPDPEENPYLPIYLRPAVNLLEILRDFRRYLADSAVPGTEYPQGAMLVHRLARWCSETGRDLQGSIISALTASEYDPLAGVRTLEELNLETLGAKPVTLKLARVLSFEMERLAEGAESWNSRLGIGHPPGPSNGQHGVSLQVWEQRSLPLEAYRTRPIVILNASMTAEQAERLFPGRQIRVLEPRAPLPEGVKVTQYLDRDYGKTVLERDERAQGQALVEVRAIVEKHQGQKVGVITHKGFADRLKSEFPELTVLNFFNHRSQNTAADVNAWIVLGTPHPNESALARATEALYWKDSRPLDCSIGYRDHEIEDAEGLRYRVSRRTARDPRLQEQLEQRTALEMEQAVFRCRPHNLAAPEQGDLFKGQEGRRRLSLDIYVFGQTPLGIPVNVVTERAARKPALLDQVMAAARKLAKAGVAITQRLLTKLLIDEGLTATYRNVINAWKWLKRTLGKSWQEQLEMEESPPRALAGSTKDRQASDSVEDEIESVGEFRSQTPYLLNVEAPDQPERAPPAIVAGGLPRGNRSSDLPTRGLAVGIAVED